MERVAVYPGSFDPCTNGHLDIISRAAAVFDKVIVGVLTNGSKLPTFTVAERVQFLKKVTVDIAGVEIMTFDGLLADFASAVGANIIIKGLRAMSDFEYEFQMALTNKRLFPNGETLFMTTSSDNSFLSSSMVKEVARHGGDISGFVPECIVEDIVARLTI